MGVVQWIFQRVSNAVIIAFGLWLLVTLITNGGMSQETINGLLSSTGVRLGLLVALLLACLNSVLAGWQIVGDYAHKFGLNATLMMGIVVIVSAAYALVGVSLLF